MRLITGQENRKTKNRISLKEFSSDEILSQEFNFFYSRFDSYDFNQEIENLKMNVK